MAGQAASKRRAMHQVAESDYEVIDKGSKKGVEAVECDICSECVRGSQYIGLDCGHRICSTCLTRLFSDAIKSEGSFPAKCCAEISITPDIDAVLGARTVSRYRTKEEEYSVLPKLRTYCSNRSCGEFIHPCFVGEDGIASCQLCSRNTCHGCKIEVDTSYKHKCTGVAEDQGLIDTAAAKGCKRCPNCAIFIELQDACNHMSCGFCQHQFCFVCLRAWGSWGSNSNHTCPRYNQPQSDPEGYIDGFHKDTGFDRDGYDRDGFNVKGFDRAGTRRPPPQHIPLFRDGGRARPQQEVDEERHAARHEFGITERELEEQHMAEQVMRIEQGTFWTDQQLQDEINARLQEDWEDSASEDSGDGRSEASETSDEEDGAPEGREGREGDAEDDVEQVEQSTTEEPRQDHADFGAELDDGDGQLW